MIKKIKNELNKVIENFDIYYNLSYNLIKNYESKNRNYEILQNINEINAYNNIIINDINNINKDNNILNKLKQIFNIYKKMSNYELIENKKNSETGETLKYINLFMENLQKNQNKGIYDLNHMNFMNNMNNNINNFGFNNQNKSNNPIYPHKTGLQNVGGSSYMNSIIQCLSNIKNLSDYLIGHFGNFDIEKQLLSLSFSSLDL